MKKRAKTPPSRRRSALKWLGCLLTLMLLCSVSGIYPLLPRQGAEDLRRRQGMAPAEMTRSFYDPTLVGMRTSRIYLMANEDTLLLAASRFHPLTGWAGFWRGAAAVEEGLPVQAGYQVVSDRSGRILYLYGRVDDATISSLTFTLSWMEEEGETWRFSKGLQKTIGQEELFAAPDGHTYFFSSLSLGEGEDFLQRVFLSCNDSAGNPILWPGRYQEQPTASFEVWQWTSTSILND